jgi:hypothetical protein
LAAASLGTPGNHDYETPSPSTAMRRDHHKRLTRSLETSPGVGPSSAHGLDYLADPADPSQRLYTRRRPACRRRLETFIGAIADVRHARRHPIWNAVSCGTSHDDDETRRADLIQLEQIASGQPSRERFLTNSRSMFRGPPMLT